MKWTGNIRGIGPIGDCVAEGGREALEALAPAACAALVEAGKENGGLSVTCGAEEMTTTVWADEAGVSVGQDMPDRTDELPDNLDLVANVADMLGDKGLTKGEVQRVHDAMKGPSTEARTGPGFAKGGLVDPPFYGRPDYTNPLGIPEWAFNLVRQQGYRASSIRSAIWRAGDGSIELELADERNQYGSVTMRVYPPGALESRDLGFNLTRIRKVTPPVVSTFHLNSGPRFKNNSPDLST